MSGSPRSSRLAPPASEASSTWLEIQLNGEPREVAAGSTILSLLEVLDRHPRTVAVERNGDIVRRLYYADTHLEAGDRLEIVHFVQGG